MIDYFAIALTHGLIALAAWRLVFRADLDRDGAEDEPPARPWLKGRDGLKDRPMDGPRDSNA